MRRGGRIQWFCLILGWGTLAATAANPLVPHVVIISMDGAAPWVVRHTPMPVLHQLFREGASTWDAETIRPTVTLPSHASMLTGVQPSRHRVTWNDWRPGNGIVQVPTIFTAAKQAGLTTAMFVGKEKLWHLLQPGSVDHFDYGGRTWAEAPISASRGSREDYAAAAKDQANRTLAVARRAADYLHRHRPNLCFIHLADPDVVGHQYGWGSPEQRRSLQEVDAALDQVIRALRRAGLRNRTVILITADHGGHGKGHSAGVLEDLLIPWIAWGAGVRSGHALTVPVNTCDTAATALWLLNVPPPVAMDGKPIRSAFRFDTAPVRPTPGAQAHAN